MKSEAGPGPGQWLSAQSVGDCRVQAVQAPEPLYVIVNKNKFYLLLIVTIIVTVDVAV